MQFHEIWRILMVIKICHLNAFYHILCFSKIQLCIYWVNIFDNLYVFSEWFQYFNVYFYWNSYILEIFAKSIFLISFDFMKMKSNGDFLVVLTDHLFYSQFVYFYLSFLKISLHFHLSNYFDLKKHLIYNLDLSIFI